MTGPRATHEVLNQPPPLTGHDVAQDPALLEALSREGAGAVAAELHELGVLAGSAQTQEQARLANDCVPRLRTHDRYGHRIDEVDYHPAWHALMSVAVSHGLHAAPWADGEPGAHLARAAKFYVWSQAEAGHSCPVSMTYAAVPALRHAPDLARRFEPLLASRVYDPGLRVPETKAGLLSGMAMTEKQGGSDVPGRHHPRRARAVGRAWRAPAHRAQVVQLGADVRPVPGPGAGARRADLLPAPPGAAGRHPQRDPDPAAQGQARQPFQRVRRGRVRRGSRLAGRRGRPGRADDHRHGHRDQAGLRAGQRRRDAPRHGSRRAPLRPPAVVREKSH